MPNWEEEMEQTYEYYIVDPDTWTDKRKLDEFTSSSVTNDANSETLSSASLEGNADLGEFYVRIYLIVTQNNLRTRHPLGTFLVQTDSSSFNGKRKKPSLTAYSPLLEMKDVMPPLGYAIVRKARILEQANSICDQYCRAPVVPAVHENDILEKDFVANTDDTWLSFLSDLVGNLKYHLDLDEMGRIMFAPDQDVEAMQPVWTYTDDNSSILMPDITVTTDMYSIPNTVEVVYSDDDLYMTAIAVNNDENSPVSTISRGRVVYERVSNPGVLGKPTQGELQEYAERYLKEKSKIECTLEYTHGYNGVRIGDCVRMNYRRADLKDIKAKVVRQQIDCKTGCSVSETAVFKKKLWG